MFRIVKSRKEIKKCQDVLEARLYEELGLEDEFLIGNRSGSKKRSVRHNASIWFAYDEMENRFWNVLGRKADLKKGIPNGIVVEINIPKNGINRQVAGVFAIEDKTKSVFLLHRGGIGGGQKGIGKKEFVKWYEKPFTEIQNDTKVEQAFLIGNIEGSDFAKKLADFVQDVFEFKLYITSVNEAGSLSLPELEEKCKERNNRPDKKERVITVYERNPHVSELAKRRAKGKCQLCGSKAPFKKKDGTPYLETHHIKWMAEGGADSPKNTVALCPNCHRKIHILKLKKDVMSLKNNAKN